MPFTSDVFIEPEHPIELPENYVEKHRFLSSEDRTVRVGFHGAELFRAVVPKGAFNPYKGVAAHKLIEMVLTGDVDVRAKRVVDLGCGSGVIGLACVQAGASSVLFTDINSAVVALQQNPLLRPQDVVRVQDLLRDEPDGAYDVILMSTPTNRVEEGVSIAADSVDSAIFRSDDFIQRLVSESARCLAPGGVLGLWIKISHEGIVPYHSFLMTLNEAYDLSSMRIYWHAQESEVNVGRQDHAGQNSHLVFWVRKKGEH